MRDGGVVDEFELKFRRQMIPTKSTYLRLYNCIVLIHDECVDLCSICQAELIYEAILWSE